MSQNLNKNNDNMDANQYTELKEMIDKMDTKVSSIMAWINGDENIKNQYGTQHKIDEIQNKVEENEKKIQKIYTTVIAITSTVTIVINVITFALFLYSQAS